MSSSTSKKIIATIGPASFVPSIVKAMDKAGVDIFRVNLSHTDPEDVETVYDMVYAWTNKPVCPDTQGVENRDDLRPRVFDFDVSRSCLSDNDVESLWTLNALGAETVFLSFCTWPEDVAEIKKHFDHPIKVISKIENKTGLYNLEEICAVSDGILVDRGDLSKDVSLVKIPYAQDYIVEKVRKHNLPVYIATNLMESMLYEPMPTRAEVNDIVKTLESGVDGLVLAGETAIGKHPVETVKIMKRIMTEFEKRPEDEAQLVKWLTEEES